MAEPTGTPRPDSLRGLLRSGVGIAVAMAVQNVAAYGFTILAARRLGPAEYSAVASLMGLLLVVVVVSLGLQATGARKIAAAPERRDEIEASVMATTYRAALGLGVLCLALTPLIAWALRLSSWPAALMIGISAIPLTIMGGQSGLLQGERRWGPLALVYLGVGVGRLVVGGTAMLLMPTALAAMAGVAVAAWVPALVGALALGHVGQAGRRHTQRQPDRILREVAGNSHALLAFFALSNVDVVVARIVLDDHVAGLYAGGLILSKAVLFLPQFVVVIAFPAMASRERRTMYLKGLLVVAVLGVSASLGAHLFSGLAVSFVGGPAYAGIQPLVGAFAALGMTLAMIQLMVYEVVARQHAASIALVWTALVAVSASAFYVDGERTLLLNVLAVDVTVLVALVVAALLHREPAQPGPAGPGTQ